MKKITNYFRTNTSLQAVVIALLFPSMVLLPSNLRANPSGGVVMGGAAEIGEGLNGHLQINQMSGRAVIDWASFSIAAGELTQFIQPGADSAVLNRVTGGSPSAIMGALQANGNVAVINTAGILVGPSGTIDVNGLLLSTLDVSNADFMGGGDMLFRGATDAGVTNMGRINAVGGDVFLLGKTVVNTGSITAGGTVGLAAGEEVLITAVANPAGERVFVRPTAGVGGGTGVDNSGTIEGAMVELKAHGNMYALAINNSGSIRATGASMSGGKVTLRAIGGTITNTGSIAATLPNGSGGRIIIDAGVGGTVNAGGKIDASATGNGGTGGVVMISGESVTVPGGAEISANGEGGGGFIQIGSGDGVDAQNVAVEAGSSISANGGSGPGGMIVIQGGADSNVMVAGAVSATS
jgi:filamentous hemagglutinin family protein